MNRTMLYPASMIPLVVLLPLLAACSGHDHSSANTRSVGDTIGSARHLVLIDKSAAPYHVSAVPSPGSLTGTASFTGTPKGDTLIQIARDQNGCGKPLVIKRLDRHRGNVTGAVVWLTDVRAGEPLPLARRFELDNDDCAWNPTIQAVFAGGTLNVTNSDPLAERAFATDITTGDTVAIAPFTDDGQLIPYDRLLRTPGVYEFSVESRPMSRAWVAVFDHPYFAVTNAAGAFTIDGIPPGTHHIRAWHPMLGITDGTVTILPNKPTTVTLRW